MCSSSCWRTTCSRSESRVVRAALPDRSGFPEHWTRTPATLATLGQRRRGLQRQNQWTLDLDRTNPGRSAIRRMMLASNPSAGASPLSNNSRAILQQANLKAQTLGPSSEPSHGTHRTRARPASSPSALRSPRPPQSMCRLGSRTASASSSTWTAARTVGNALRSWQLRTHGSGPPCSVCLLWMGQSSTGSSWSPTDFSHARRRTQHNARRKRSGPPLDPRRCSAPRT
mmetsp:Transcript_54/g.106  ORF Transcript_54/g.106 Transcript_54/m.106 type:complete len:228 (+) Transcript_54:908-1591(+)